MKYKKKYDYQIISRYPDEDVAVPEEIMEAQILNWMESILLNYSIHNQIEFKVNMED
ncbi:hypothetical protein PTQ21_12330 [Paenibacillus marchantiae]|uniref:hypothetical protein n=1 Tax=Paenibacillus marchantiae TaxID=3026433 RepID=UPI00237AFA67|nr:hypothetical protein [Paenibacillus marchantiae]WDQ34974.1 hypothetical protein PTQ21_12330 [Paenibacillus marchantiae]